MKAVALRGVGDMELTDIPEPEPGPGELKLRVRFCGVCGSDLHEFESNLVSALINRQSPIMGHEFSAEVVGLGPGVDGFSAGDLVVVNPGEACGECDQCKKGRGNLCERALGIGYHRPGAYAERLCVKATSAVKLRPDAPSDQAALTEPLAVALHALNQGGLRPDETVFVAGSGPIGALCVVAARHLGAGKVIVSEPAPSRRSLAQRLGADEVIDPAASPASLRLLELTEGVGADLAVECAGVAPALDDCLAGTRRRGRIVVASIFEQPYPILLLRTMYFEHHVIGAFGYGEEFAQAAHLIASGEIDVAPLISRTVGLAELPAAFAELASDRDRYHKVLVSPDA
jgi:(R,R)-butanediol dehydrogenase/meso-butanediol dehydrogenase/diacetyl reductase